MEEIARCSETITMLWIERRSREAFLLRDNSVLKTSIIQDSTSKTMMMRRLMIEIITTMEEEVKGTDQEVDTAQIKKLITTLVLHTMGPQSDHPLLQISKFNFK